VEVTAAVIAAAAGNICRGEQVIRYLLRQDETIPLFTEAAVEATAQHFNADILKLLLTRDDRIKITESTLAAAARNQKHGKAVVSLLLATYPEVAVTEEVFIAAAGNPVSGAEVTNFLLARVGSAGYFTEATFTAMAGNRGNGKALASLL